MRQFIFIIISIVVVLTGCSKEIIFMESKEIKDFPIPKEAEYIGKLPNNSYKYYWEEINPKTGISKIFIDKAEEYGWELNGEENEKLEYLFIKNDRNIKVLLEENNFILSEKNNLPENKDEGGNYILNYDIIFDGANDNVFFENTLEENAYEWFMDTIEKIQMGTEESNYYSFNGENNIYQYVILTQGNKLEKVYISPDETSLTIEVKEQMGEEKEMQLIKFKSYPSIKKTIKKNVS